MSQADPTELDVNAFARLFNSAARDLRTNLRRKLGRNDDADEIVQEAMLRIWGSRATVSMETARPLLFRIASNLAIDRLREHGRWRFSDIAAAEPPNEAISAERDLAARQELAVIQAAIQALPEKCRTAFVLSRVEGWKHAEIASHMGVSKSMVEKHVAEAAFRMAVARQKAETVKHRRRCANDENLNENIEVRPASAVVDAGKEP